MADLEKENLALKKENESLKKKLEGSQTANKKLAEDLKQAQEDLKAAKKSDTIKDAVKNSLATLSDGKKVQVNFGVNVPELGKNYTKDELLTDEDAIRYLLEIGSGAVSIVKEKEA